MSIEDYEYRGHTITIGQDCDNESPRDWGHGSTILYGHNHYTIGEVSISEWEGEFYDRYDREPASWKDWAMFVREHRDAICIKPVYMYDHSGITISTGPFSCPWDSGQVGIIYTTQAIIDKNWAHCKTQPTMEDIDRGLESEIDVYDQYLRGEIYYYSIDGDLCNDSLGGMYGDIDDYVKKTAQDEIDAAYEREAQEADKVARCMAL